MDVKFVTAQEASYAADLGVRRTQSLEASAVYLRAQQVFAPTPNAEPLYGSA